MDANARGEVERRHRRRWEGGERARGTSERAGRCRTAGGSGGERDVEPQRWPLGSERA